MTALALKANANGSLRTSARLLSGATFDYPLVANCVCSTLPPPQQIFDGLVDTGERTAVTGSGQAHFGAYTYEVGPPVYKPSATFTYGATGSATAAYWPPDTLGVGAIWEEWGLEHWTLGGVEVNVNWVLALQGTAGGVSDAAYYDLAAEPAAGDVDSTFTCTAALLARIRELGRYHDAGNIWPGSGPGPRPGTGGSNIDIRGYKNADLRWYYWSPSADAVVTISASGHSLTVTDSGGVPVEITAASAAMENANGTNAEAWLTFSYFGSQPLPALDDTYGDATNLVHSWADGDTVHTVATGSAPDWQYVHLSRADVQPVRAVSFTFAADRQCGESLPDGAIDLQALDGPVVSDVGGAVDLTAETEYPPGNTIDAHIPGIWGGTGEAYDVDVYGRYAGMNIAPIDASGDTTGDYPGFAFAMTPSSLEGNGFDGDNWRVGIPIPGGNWEAIWLRRRPSANDAGLTGWSAGNTDSTVSATASAVSVSTVGIVAAAQKTMAAASGCNGGRYLRVRLTATESAQEFTLEAPSGRTWEWVVTGTQTTTLDLCVPDTAGGFDALDTAIGAAAESGASGGWSWGIESGIVVTLASSAGFALLEFRLVSGSGADTAHIGESFRLVDVLGTGEDYTDYARAGALWLQSGRTAMDSRFGTVRVGPEVGSWPQAVTDRRTISQVAADARVRLSSVGCVEVRDMRPASRKKTHVAGWGTAWDYYIPTDFFNGAVEAYHLDDVHSVASASYAWRKFSATYCVDRVTLGLGSWTFSCRRNLGAALAGIATDSAPDACALPVGIIETGDSDTADSGGVWELPNTGAVADGQTYTLNDGYEGLTQVQTYSGTLRRIGLTQ